MKTLSSSIVVNDVSPEFIREFSKSRNEPSWVQELRSRAFDRYNALPWPTLRDEKWKRTELSLLTFDKLKFRDSSATASAEVGWLSFPEAIKSEESTVKEAWTKAIEQAASNKFLLLTLALATEGSFRRIKKESSETIRLPIVPVEAGIASFAFNVVVVDENAQVQFWEETPETPMNGDGKSLGFLGSYTALILKSNAQASHYGLQHWNDRVIHFQFQDTYQDRDSRLNAIAVQIGGRVYRNELVIHLAGQGAENKILGVLFGDGSQNFENWITQNHLAKKTVSDIQYRGALKGASHSFFSGLVSIIKSAQQSDAYQSSKSLLLSKEARADAIPNLEILADDVKCAHGAAVGPVDEDQKFYLQTRGVPPEEAERIIIEGFFEPVISEVPSETTQDKLRVFVEEKLSRA